MFMDPNSGWTWVLAIVSLTVVVRTLMIPLFVRQINSSRSMQLIQPEDEAHCRRSTATTASGTARRVMKLYKEEGVNPAASCLPLLLQMPIFIGLFNVLNGAARGIGRSATSSSSNRELVDSLRHATIFGAEISGRSLHAAS